MMVDWDGYVPTLISWQGGDALRYFRTPCRNNTPLTFSFTFKDQSLNVIDLTPYPIVNLILSRNGSVLATVQGVMVSAQNGQVQATFTPALAGLYDAQFSVANNLDATLYGDPVQFTVVPNLPDLVNQQPNY